MAIITTHQQETDNRLDALLREKGYAVCSFPTISIQAIEEPETFKQISNQIDRYNVLIFTSKNGVVHFFNLLERFQPAYRFAPVVKVYSIGRSTDEYLQTFGYQSDFISHYSNSDVFFEELKELLRPNDSVLFPTGKLTPDKAELMIGAICHIERINVYDTLKPEHYDPEILERILNDDYQIITFMSPSAFRNFCDILPGTFDFRRLRAAAFGKTTLKVIEEKGLSQVISIEKSNIDDFVNQIITYTF